MAEETEHLPEGRVEEHSGQAEIPHVAQAAAKSPCERPSLTEKSDGSGPDGSGTAAAETESDKPGSARTDPSWQSSESSGKARTCFMTEQTLNSEVGSLTRTRDSFGGATGQESAVSSPHSFEAMRKSIELRTQEEYEAYLIDQLSKLRETIETEEVKNMQRQAELAQRRALQREKKAEAAERADRIAQLEDMLVAAQEEESRKLAERRVAADERQRVRQAEIERVRAVEQRKKEEARALQRELHEQTLLRHAKERAVRAAPLPVVPLVSAHP
eukprot:6197723-Pleurochrysis_carterae.AAC.5